MVIGRTTSQEGSDSMSITRFVLQDITLVRITLVLVSKTGSWLVLVYFSSMAIPMLFINTMRLYQLANTTKLENISRIYLQSAKKLVTTEMEKPPLTENLELYQSVGEYDNARANLEKSLVISSEKLVTEMEKRPVTYILELCIHLLISIKRPENISRNHLRS